MKQYYADPSKVEGRSKTGPREHPVLERVGDDEGLARAWLAMAELRLVGGAMGCRRGGHRERRSSTPGPATASSRSGRRRTSRCAPSTARRPSTRRSALRGAHRPIGRRSQGRGDDAARLAHMHAMQGDFESARDEYRRAQRCSRSSAGRSCRPRLDRLRADRDAGRRSRRGGGRAAAGLRDARPAGRPELHFDRGRLPRRSALSAGPSDESGTLAAFSAEVAAPDDVATQVALARRVRQAPGASRSADEAERIAREAVELSRREDDPIDQANALMDLGAGPSRRGRARRGEHAGTEALGLYERKGNLVSAAASPVPR